MKKLYKLLRILFAGIFILGTIAIIYIGWQTQEGIKKWNVDNSLNTLVCNNGKNYLYQKYSDIKSVQDINFLQDTELRSLCVYGSYMDNSDKQKILDVIYAYDNQYYEQKKVYLWTDAKGEFYLVNPLTTVDPRTVKQLTDDNLFKLFKEQNQKLYLNVSYTLKNTPPVVKINYTPTIETLLLFWFVLYLVIRFIYYVMGNKRLNEVRLRLSEHLYFKNPLIMPSLIIGVCLLAIAYLVSNNSNSANVQDALAVNQKCHDLATKYVDNKVKAMNSSIFGLGSDNSGPYSYTDNFNGSAYNQSLNTCLADYAIDKSVNSMASPAPSPLPSISEWTYYVDDVISGDNLGQVNLSTDCDSNKSYCQNLVDFSLKEKSWGLSSLSPWETIFLQTIGRLGFVRSWMGL